MACRRAVLNEAQLLSHISSAWDVDVVRTNFNMPLREAITLMQASDVLVGMHGAGRQYSLGSCLCLGVQCWKCSAVCRYCAWVALDKSLLVCTASHTACSSLADMGCLSVLVPRYSCELHVAHPDCAHTGLTNTFWMRPGAVMVQLFPYGWQLDSGEIIRTGLSRDMPLSLNGSYFQACLIHLAVLSDARACLH